MKFSLVAGLLAAAVSSVAAAPAKWVVVSKHVEGQTASALRIGIVIPSISGLPEGHPSSVDPLNQPVRHYNHRPGCKGMVKAKTIELSNKFRAVLGLPLIHPTGSKHNEYQMESVPMLAPQRVWHHGPPQHRHHHNLPHDAPFVARLTHSLNNLGKWEGRAVAFVIGCGLGVLLRIVYVFAVMMIRSCRGKSDEEEEEEEIEYVVFEAGASAPPSYLTAEEEKEQLKATVA